MNTLIDSIKDKNAGLGVDKHKDEYGIETVTLQIEGMGCGCEWSMVEQKMKALAGVRRSELNPMTRHLLVSYDPGAATIQDIIRSVSETGMKASLAKSRAPRSTWWREKQQLALYGCGLLSLIAFASGQLGATHVVTIALITSVMAFKGLNQPEIFLQIEIARRAERIRTGQNIEMDAMRNWLFITLMGMVLLISACGGSPTFRMYKDGYAFSLGSGAKAKYNVLCASGDLNKILADTHLNTEMKNTIYQDTCSERSGEKINKVYASMTAEQRKDIKVAFKKYGYKVKYCPT